MVQPTLTELDEIIEAFEAARHRTGAAADLRSFAPGSDHPHYRRIVTELIRVDLEHSWNSGHPTKLTTYQETFPDVFADTSCRSEIAFEEYRLRQQAGGNVDPTEYAQAFRIDVAGWSRFNATGNSAARNSGELDEWTEWSQVDPVTAQRCAAGIRELPSPGQKFGDFELVEELGRGAFARVFLARQAHLANRWVALKISPGSSAEFLRLAQLQHTHIVPVYSVHRQGNLQAICMPFLGRTTLADILRSVRRRGELPASGRELLSTLVAGGSTLRDPTDRSSCVSNDAREPIDETDDSKVIGSTTAGDTAALRQLEQSSYTEAILWVVTRIAEGLAHAHEMGIVHRDLKPANILLGNQGFPLILDFNVAADLTCSSTAAAMIGGTLPYMSPEQLSAFQAGGAVDGRSDIFSLGVILYELLSGRLPYPVHRGSSDPVIRRMIDERRRSPLPIRARSVRITPSLWSIILRCLAFDPADRYQTATELAEDLERFLAYRPLRHAPERSWRERCQKWFMRHPRLTSGATVSVVSLGILTVAALGWGIRERHVSGLAARAVLQKMEDELPGVRVGMSDFGLGGESRLSARQAAEALLGQLGVEDDPHWMDASPFSRLEDSERERLMRGAAELLYWLAQDELRPSPTGSPDPANSISRAKHWNELARHCYPTVSPRAIETLAASIGSPTNPRPKLDSGPASPDPLDRINDAITALRHGDFVAAAHVLETVTRDRPRDYAAWYWLGHAYWGQSQLVDAEICFSVCTALQPDAYPGYFQRGLVRLERRQPATAADDFSQVILRRPGFAGAFTNRGIARQQSSDHRGALEDFSRAKELGARETRLDLLRARSLAQLGDSPASREALAEGLAQTPSDEASWLARGFAQLGSAPEAALDDFRQALALNPASTSALQNIAAVLSDYLPRPDDAIRALDQLIHMQPGRRLWRSSRAVLQARLGHTERALADVGDAESGLAASQPNEENPLIYYQTACVYSLIGTRPESADQDAEHALKSLAQALTLQPSLAVTARRDPDLARLRESPAGRDLIESANRLLEARATRPGDAAPAATKTAEVTE